MKKLFAVLTAVLMLTAMLSFTAFADDEKVVTDAEPSSEVITTGAATNPEGSGDYTGGDVLFDDEGNVTGVEQDGEIAPLAEENGSKSTVFIIIAVAAVVVAGGAVAFVIFKKKCSKKIKD